MTVHNVPFAKTRTIRGREALAPNQPNVPLLAWA